MNKTEKMVLILHEKGISVSDIAARLGKRESTVYTYLSKNGKSHRRQKSQLGISTQRIKQVRNRAQVGNRIRVKSVKTLMFGDGNIKQGSVPVMAKVLSKANRYFCLVELPGGTRECILWIDMVGENLDRY